MANDDVSPISLGRTFNALYIVNNSYKLRNVKILYCYVEVTFSSDSLH
jgi:hypothetical protein